jgi:DNA-binding CsgD family transcriptional regulator
MTKHGLRDGFLFSGGSSRWLILLASRRLVSLEESDRADLETTLMRATRRLNTNVRKRHDKRPPLALGEQAVLRTAVLGMNEPQIAEYLHLSRGTVSSYLKRIKKKTGAKTVAQAVITAARWMVIH